MEQKITSLRRITLLKPLSDEIILTNLKNGSFKIVSYKKTASSISMEKSAIS